MAGDCKSVQTCVVLRRKIGECTFLCVGGCRVPINPPHEKMLYFPVCTLGLKVLGLKKFKVENFGVGKIVVLKEK